jgi:hypothetical protein
MKSAFDEMFGDLSLTEADEELVSKAPNAFAQLCIDNEISPELLGKEIAESLGNLAIKNYAGAMQMDEAKKLLGALFKKFLNLKESKDAFTSTLIKELFVQIIKMDGPVRQFLMGLFS